MDHLQDRWLSIKEICAYLGVSDDTVYRWIKFHDMPTHKMGRLWKFKINEIDEWVKAGGATLKSIKARAKKI
ncbi:MAG: helix-turn-helix domain-containing protein [Candidatus Cloacimonetes bacterium]|nr:helix-turn-helix domain-containing protein [Candidatus Cloacimonadota bacterium]